MRITSAIKDRLEQNAQQRRGLRLGGEGISRTQEIHLEYLRIEEKTFNDMLIQIQDKRWKLLNNRKLLLMLTIFGMSLYVLGMFYMFKEMDLSRVEQWQFAVTAMPFWLILTIIPVAAIALITARR